MPSKTAIVYRVSYRRENWKKDFWKNKLFNSELAATNYAANLVAPVTEKTPERYRALQRIDGLTVSFGMVQWVQLGGDVPMRQPLDIVNDDKDGPCPPGFVRIAGQCYEMEPDNG